MNLRKFFLICGYRRHGKNVVGEILREGYSEGIKGMESASYRKEKFVVNKFEGDLVEKSFAAELKKMAARIYNIPEIIPDDEKDVVQYRHPITKKLSSARDFFIELARIKRDENINYWCIKALEGSRLSSGVMEEQIKNSIVITDWRYKNELVYVRNFCQENDFDLITIRVFRVSAPIPPPGEQSEHQLDDVETDYVVFYNDDAMEGDVMERIKELFPQYLNFEVQ